MRSFVTLATLHQGDFWVLPSELKPEDEAKLCVYKIALFIRLES